MGEDPPNKNVPFYDVPNQRIIEIPRSELAQGAIQVQIDGVDGLVWVDAGQLKPSEICHPPFAGTRRESVMAIHQAFAEHRSLTYDEWEVGFRRDSNPDSEIAIWLHAAQVYTDFAEMETALARRQELHKILIACLTTEQDAVWNVLSLVEFTDDEAKKIVNRYYG